MSDRDGGGTTGDGTDPTETKNSRTRPAMIELTSPDREALLGAVDATLEDLPGVALARRHREIETVEDVPGATVAAIEQIEETGGFDDVESGAEVAITAGSRGIDDKPTVLTTAVSELKARGFEPFVFPAMGSHGGATATGQKETIESYGITGDSLGCEIRSSMDVERVGEDSDGRPIFVASDALSADAILLVNRVKPHTDYRGELESGLAKMAVVGMGKHRGAESFHNAGLAGDFATVLADRADRLFATLPIVGGIAIVENAEERAAVIEGIARESVLERESELLERARTELPMLPVDELDLLIVDEIGKDVSGTGMDTNVIGRVAFLGEDEPESPSITRIYARSLTPASHGNGLGMGLADFLHRDVLSDLDLADTYVNVVTSGEPNRTRIPFVVPDDELALLLAPSMTGADPTDLRFARIRSTSEPDELIVSEPVARELRDREDVTVGPIVSIQIEENGMFEDDPYH